jgi:hypothetical protein
MSIQIEFDAKTEAFSAAVDKLVGSAKQLGEAFKGAAPGSDGIDKLAALDREAQKAASDVARLKSEMASLSESGSGRTARIFDDGYEINDAGKRIGKASEERESGPGWTAGPGGSSATDEERTAAMAQWRKEMDLGTQATITHDRAMVDLSGHAGKTAADFKPATAEMRAASIAEEEVGKSAGRAGSGLGAFRGTMRALRFDVFEVVSVLGLMVKAMDVSAKADAAQRHLANQGISNVSGIKLEGAARDENFEPRQYYDAAVSMKVAGVNAKELVSDITELGKSSRISGVPFEKLVDTADSITEALETGGIPSLEEMKTLTLASSGATQGLTDEYRQLAGALVENEKAWKLEEEAQARSHKETEEHASAATAFADKIGLSAKVFAAFAAQTSYAPGMGEGMMSGQLTKEYSEGLAQITKESGMSTQQIREFMTAGTVGYADLISASGRYRAHQQEELQFSEKQRDETERLRSEERERAMGLEALKSVMTQSDFKDKQAALEKASPAGVQEEMQAQLTSAMKMLGDAVVKWFPEIKVAMLVLAGVEIASRLAAINSRFFPGPFKPPGGVGAGGAAAGEGEAAAAGGTGILSTIGKALPWVALGAAFESIPDSTGKTTQYWKEHPALKKEQDERDKTKPAFIPEIFGIPLWKASADNNATGKPGAPVYTQESARAQMLGTQGAQGAVAPSPPAVAADADAKTELAKQTDLLRQLVMSLTGS